jgi:pyridoxal biosynthesis lyase PdxS
MKKILFLFTLGLIVSSCEPDEIIDPIENKNKVVTSNITTNTTWYSDTVYQLGGRIAVEDGATLTMQPGTVIKGEAGTGDVSHAMMHMRKIGGEIRRLSSLREDELYVAAKELQAPYALVKEVAETGKLPVVLFTAGGIATPADAALMMAMGADGVFIGSGI